MAVKLMRTFPRNKKCIFLKSISHFSMGMPELCTIFGQNSTILAANNFWILPLTHSFFRNCCLHLNPFFETPSNYIICTRFVVWLGKLGHKFCLFSNFSWGYLSLKESLYFRLCTTSKAIQYYCLKWEYIETIKYLSI